MNRFLAFARPVAISLAAAAAGWWLTDAWHKSRRAVTPGPADHPARPGWVPGSADRTLGAAMTAVAAAGEVDDQMAAAIALASRIHPKDFATFLQSLRQLPAHTAQGLASRTVLRRWAAIDPAAALRWCVAHDRDLVSGVLDEWARTTPPGQLVSIHDQVPLDHRPQALASVFKSLVTHDPEAAVTLLERPEAGAAIHLISRHLLSELAHADPEWLIDRAEVLPDHLRQSLRGAALQAMAETNADDAIAWAMDQSDRDSLLTGLVRQPTLLPTVIGAIAALPATEHDRININSSTLNRLQGAEFTAFINAIATHHGQLSDRFLQRSLSLLSGPLGRSDDPGTLASQLLALGNPAFQISTFTTVWAERSPAAARAWAATLTDEFQRAEAIQAIDFAANPPNEFPILPLAHRLTRQAVEGQLHQPEQLNALNADQRLQVFQSIIQQSVIPKPEATHNHGSWASLSSHFPVDAAHALTQSLTSANAAILIQPVTATASKWATENPLAAATWAATLPPGDTRAWAAANVISQWRLFDEPAARAWLRTLPPDEHPIAAKGFGG